MSRERVEPGVFAYQLVEHVADVHGDENAYVYLAEVVSEVMELHPAVKERFVDAVLTDLIEEVVRVEDPRYSRAVVQLIEDIASNRRNDD